MRPASPRPGRRGRAAATRFRLHVRARLGHQPRHGVERHAEERGRLPAVALGELERLPHRQTTQLVEIEDRHPRLAPGLAFVRSPHVNTDRHPDPRDVWDNPLASRYASAEMTRLWSDNHRYMLWRKTWLALAEAEAELGLPISQGQLAEMRAQLANKS